MPYTATPGVPTSATIREAQVPDFGLTKGSLAINTMSRSLAQGSHFTNIALTESIPPPPIRLNRPPSEEERRALLEVIERDERSITRLQDLADKLSVKVFESNLTASRSLVQLQYASLRQEAAMDLHERLSKAIEILGTISPVVPKMEHLGEESRASPHVLEVVSTLHKQMELTERLGKNVAEAVESVKRAIETVTLAKENYQTAVTIALLQEKEQERSRESIKALKGMIKVNKTPLHSWFQTPRDVWEQILAEVVSEDGEVKTDDTIENVKEWGHGYRTLMLSSVCYDWRKMIRSLPSLWRNIYLPLDLRLRPAAARIRIHLKYSKAFPLKVVIYAPIAAVPIHSLESPLPWNEGTSVDLMTCLVSHYSYNILSDVIRSLPPPKRLKLSGDQSLGGLRSNNHPLPLLLPGHFFKDMEYLLSNDVPTRMDSSGSTVNQSALTEYIHYGHRIIGFALPSWIPHLGANLQHLYFDPAHARLVPFTQGPTSYTFTNVRTLRISIIALAQCWEHNITFPFLTGLDILHTMYTTNADWRVLQTMRCEQLGAVCLISIEKQHASQFVAFLNQCRMVSRLVLGGEAVDAILGERGDAPIARFQHVTHLVIINCRGGYETALSYLQLLVAAGEPRAMKNREKCALKSVGFRDCSLVNREALSKISVLLSQL